MTGGLRTSTAAPVLLPDDEMATIWPDVGLARRMCAAQVRRVVEDLNRRAEDLDLWPSWVRAGFWTAAREYQKELDEHEQLPDQH